MTTAIFTSSSMMEAIFTLSQTTWKSNHLKSKQITRNHPSLKLKYCQTLSTMTKIYVEQLCIIKLKLGHWGLCHWWLEGHVYMLYIVLFYTFCS